MGNIIIKEDVTPKPVPVNLVEQVVAKIRERYSINDELALLRQKDTKTAEFQAYYQYVEECKSNIKAN